MFSHPFHPHHCCQWVHSIVYSLLGVGELVGLGGELVALLGERELVARGLVGQGELVELECVEP